MHHYQTSRERSNHAANGVQGALSFRCGRRSLLLLLILLILVVALQQSRHNDNSSPTDEKRMSLPALFRLPRMSTLLDPLPCPTGGTKARLEGPLEYDDPELLSLIRDQYLQPPSTEAYTLMEDDSNDKMYRKYQETTIFLYARNVIRHYFKETRNGVFVEAGALDGEYLSNTLQLEKDQGWTGLLVEPDHAMYQQVLKKNRKAWASNCCLATKPFPHKAILARSQLEPIGGAEQWMVFKRGQAALLESRTSSIRLKTGFPLYERVQCLPLASLLLALNVTKVDYISLDVEDVEDSIIDNFPFDRIQVDVWYIEHRLPNTTMDEQTQVTDTAFISKFTSRGYTHHIMGDYVFVRNGSAYSNLPGPPMPRITENTRPKVPSWVKQK